LDRPLQRGITESDSDSDCYINDCLVFDVYSVKRMYNVKVSTGKNT